MNIERIEFDMTSSASDVTQLQSANVSGRILSVHVIQSATVPFASTGVITLKSERTGQTLYSETLSATGASLNKVPRQVVHTSAGVALTATEGYVREPFYVGNERLTASATACGSSKNVKLVVFVG
jgi:hypothetical protein